MEKKIYSSYAFTENEREKMRINMEILKELEEKYKILKVSDVDHKSPTEDELNNNDIVYSRKACYAHGEYKIYKCPNEVSVDELALICDGGNLCFGYRGDKKFISVKERKIKMENKIVLKVSSKSNPNSVAGAIAGGLQENKRVELQAIGAGAVNQSMKAIAIARSFVAAIGVDLSCVPAFCTVIVENEEKTGMKFIIKEEK